MTTAVHARDSMAAGALVNHTLPERNITPARVLKIANSTVRVKGLAFMGTKERKNKREEK